jgi:hypothetical protein
MAGGGQACNVYWQLNTAVSLDATKFLGNILAGSAITFTGVGSSLVGRALAKTAVTATGANITGDCTAQPGPAPAPQPMSCSDRVTGGGYISTGGGRANFGITAGNKKGALRGHLTYIDHKTGLKVKGTRVTAYVVVDAKTRHIEGTAKIDGVAGTYTVDVTDNGERGNNDTFVITLLSGSTVYTASGPLAGGNIQLHKRHCDKADTGHHGHGQGDDHDDDDHDDDEGDHGDDHGDHDKDHGKTPKPYGSDDKKRK